MLTDLFLSCDWGTSSFRLRLVQLEPFAVLHELRAEDGVGVIAQALPADVTPEARAAAFLAVLHRHQEALAVQAGISLATLPVYISGMASASIGWRELPYAPTPFPLDGQGVVWANVAPPAEPPIMLISGVRTATDVMRGEEAEILGIFADLTYRQYSEDALLILPGTHAKHVRIQENAVVDFTTHLTGELYAILAQHSILRHSLGEQFAEGEDGEAAFIQGVTDAQSAPLTSLLFHVRTNQLLHGRSGGYNARYLRGLLLGSELADLRQRYPEPTPILLCAGSRHAAGYLRALEVLGLQARVVSVPPEVVEHAPVRGHLAVAARHELMEVAP